MSQSNPPRTTRTALVLQGGGALGAYQAGVYQGLDEAGYQPNWIIGTSIGALNGAVIAGNAPERRVERLWGFWRAIASTDFETFMPTALRHSRMTNYLNELRTKMVGNAGFFTPRITLGLDSFTAESASLYDTAPILRTLKEYVDFDRLNGGDMRLSVGASSVTRGRMIYFDSGEKALQAEHILASGSLPPAFPAVHVEDDFYWDGGLCSNTPLEALFQDDPHSDSLCFIVNLWNAEGPAPTTLPDVFAREKEIRYSSRFINEVEVFQRTHQLRHAINTLYQSLPQSRRDDEKLKALGDLGSDTRLDVVRLGRRAHDWELSSKDVNFSWAVIRERWQHGYRDATRMVEDAPWKQRGPEVEGVKVYEPDSDE